jgi:hypothetical protein
MRETLNQVIGLARCGQCGEVGATEAEQIQDKVSRPDRLKARIKVHIAGLADCARDGSSSWRG